VVTPIAKVQASAPVLDPFGVGKLPRHSDKTVPIESTELAGESSGMSGLGRLFRIAAWGCVAAITLLSLLPAEEMVRTGIDGHIEHAIAYAGTSFFVALIHGKRGFGRLPAVLIFYAGVLEILQRFSPGRHSAFDDFLASSAGVLIGLAAFMLWRAVRRRRAWGYS